MSSKRKVVVVGAGLAGLYAAYSAAFHGADVTLLEKSTIGTAHNCGELFTEVYTTAPAECKLGKIENFMFHIDSEEYTTIFGDNSPFYMTVKCKHEEIMKDKCLTLGVDIKEKTKSTRELLSKGTVINAAGVSAYNGNMGKAVVYIADKSCYSSNIYYNTAIFNVRDDLMGYSWIFPRGKDFINIGEGVYDYKYKTELMKIDRKHIAFSGGGMLPMPTMVEYCKNIIHGNTFTSGIRVGNSAGLINPVLGGGEHLAVLSGMLAGELVAKEREKDYYKALDEIIGDEMRFGISTYEFLRKQDIDTVKEIFATNLKLSINVINKNVRRNMKKWITIPEVSETEIEDFIGE